MFFQAFYQSDLVGRIIFFFLFTLSIVSWYFLIHKIWTLTHIKIQARTVGRKIRSKEGIFANLKIEPSFDLTYLQSEIGRPIKRKSSQPFLDLYLVIQKKTAEILDKNQAHSPESHNYLSRTDVESLNSHLQSAIVTKRASLEKDLFVLSTTVTLAPFLGLLGTVWGILITFEELQAGRLALEGSMILGGLSMALTTTVFGLFIAIPALIAYNYLKNLTRHFFTQMQEFSHFLLSTVELQYRKVDVE